jgi:ubiquinone/menaquinone biosynthesis C-methylase UbiE
VIRNTGKIQKEKFKNQNIWDPGGPMFLFFTFDFSILNFMNVEQAYNQWAAQYDTNENKTRDLEKKVLRDTLSNLSFQKVLEIGCGTGKNTEWLIQKAGSVTSVDFSAEMLAKAKEKINSNKVRFKQADITYPWDFADGSYDLVSFSLVLEHISNLDLIFQQTNSVLKPGGHVYIAELHPFKQYSGSKGIISPSLFKWQRRMDWFRSISLNISMVTPMVCRAFFV